MKTLDIESLKEMCGQELGKSKWILLDQKCINTFAAATGDHQFIHVDPERAKNETPFGSTIAHGALSLSVVTAQLLEIAVAPQGTKMVFNYGLEGVRFLSPVLSGKKIRVMASLRKLEEKGPSRFLAYFDFTVEIENEEKPAVIGTNLCMFIMS